MWTYVCEKSPLCKVDSLVFYHTIVFLFLFFVFPLKKRERERVPFLREASFLSATSIICTSRGMNLITMRNLFIPLYFFHVLSQHLLPPFSIFAIMCHISPFPSPFILSSSARFYQYDSVHKTVFLFQQAPSTSTPMNVMFTEVLCGTQQWFPQFLLEETFQGSSLVLEQSGCLKEKQTIISHSCCPLLP